MNPEDEYPRKARVIRFEEGEGERDTAGWRSAPASDGAAGSSRIEPVGAAAQPAVSAQTPLAYSVATPGDQVYRETPRAASVATPTSQSYEEPPLASSVATPPARRGGDRRPGCSRAPRRCLLGIVGGLWLTPGRDREDRAETTTSTTTETASTTPVDPAAPTAIAGAYRNPDAASVERALVSVRSDFAAGGLTTVSGQSRACFDSLARTPGYAELDYCVAYDAYGAALAKRLAQGQPLPDGSWFAETEERALRTAQTVVGTRGDPAARLLDIRRLTVAVAANNPAERTQIAAAQPGRKRAQAEPRPQAAPRAEPRPSRSRARSRGLPPCRRSRPGRLRRRSHVACRPRPSRGSSLRRRRCSASRSRPRAPGRASTVVTPRTSAERLVCSDPVLAAADWRLHNAFEQASAQTDRPGALRREQDRWLAAREAAAPDPRAVLDVYEQRIDELSRNY
jgi:hypothetical protein